MAAETTTKIEWEHPVLDVKERYQKGLESYAYLKNDTYQHKREQLLLMLRQGCSDDFIRAFFEEDSGISSVDLDFLRTMALFAGETFVKENFYKKTVSDVSAKQVFTDHLVRENYKQIPDIEKLLGEVRQMQEQFQAQMSFLKDEQERARMQYKEAAKKTEEASQAEMERLKAEIEKYKKKYIRMQEENAGEIERRTAAEEALQKLKQEAEALQKQEEEALKRESAMLQEKCSVLKEAAGDAEKEQSCFQKLLFQREAAKRRKEKEARNKLVLRIISDERYSQDQLKVILKAINNGIATQPLQKLCNPNLSASNMEILELYFEQGKEKRNEGTGQ